MQPLNNYTAQTILEDAVFIEVFEQEDEIYKSRLILSLLDRAAELGVKAKFETMLKAYRKVDKEVRKKQKSSGSQILMDNWTEFEGPYERMYCGSWIAGENGVWVQNTGTADQVACYHPILPVERLKNLETGEEQIKIAYKRNNRWEEFIVPKTIIATANKIVNLASRGVSVTSENAKLLVRYLSDLENLNTKSINVQYSSAKLGWIKNGFIPYSGDVIFDGDNRFGHVKDAICEHGSRAAWYDYVKEIRKRGRIEAKFFLAASFASVLVHVIGGLPFVVDLWGATEGGKSVTLMLACSVWANPDENQYIGDFKTTDVALESRADMLNNLPMMLDDTSKVSSRIRDNFEGFIYDLCSGKGKSRSNKELGINRENTWRNVTLTNGERPLTSYANQGGAINRVLELECGANVYADPMETAEFVKKNYGFAGKDFVDAVNYLGTDQVKRIYHEFLEQLADDEKMQKQSMSLACLLAADKIATEQLFKDRQYIPIDEAKKVLVDRQEVSDNERCYQYIMSEIDINKVKFDQDIDTLEKWGGYKDGYVYIYNNVFDNMCKKGNFSSKAFLSWTDRQGLLLRQSGKSTRVVREGGKMFRAVFLKLDDGLRCDENGFISTEGIQEKLPFD